MRNFVLMRGLLDLTLDWLDFLRVFCIKRFGDDDRCAQAVLFFARVGAKGFVYFRERSRPTEVKVRNDGCLCLQRFLSIEVSKRNIVRDRFLLYLLVISVKLVPVLMFLLLLYEFSGLLASIDKPVLIVKGLSHVCICFLVFGGQLANWLGRTLVRKVLFGMLQLRIQPHWVWALRRSLSLAHLVHCYLQYFNLHVSHHGVVILNAWPEVAGWRVLGPDFHWRSSALHGLLVDSAALVRLLTRIPTF